MRTLSAVATCGELVVLVSLFASVCAATPLTEELIGVTNRTEAIEGIDSIVHGEAHTGTIRQDS